MRVVVEHAKLGLYLGVGAGRHWWTKQPVNVVITEVVTFNDAECAMMFMATHYPQDMDLLEFHEIECDNLHAPIKTLVQAGLGDHCKKLLHFTQPIGNA